MSIIFGGDEYSEEEGEILFYVAKIANIAVIAKKNPIHSISTFIWVQKLYLRLKFKVFAGNRADIITLLIQLSTKPGNIPSHITLIHEKSYTYTHGLSLDIINMPGNGSRKTGVPRR